MNEEKKPAALDENDLEAVSGGMEYSKPQFHYESLDANDPTDQVNGQLVVDGNMKQP